MNDPQPAWSVLFLLPNIVLRDEPVNSLTTTLGLKGIGLARVDDPRVSDYLNWSHAAKRLVQAFRTEYGAPQQPTFLIGKRAALTKLGKRPEPIIAFRNAVALACVLHHRAAGRSSGPTWTDSFDHSSAEVTVDGGRVDIRTPALTSWDVPLKKLILARDPGLPLATVKSGDHTLAAWLGRAWRDTYRLKRNVQRGRQLFRSLELAYLAASMRSRNYSSIHEVGIGTVLWVSAIEILASPLDRKVQRLDGHRLVGEYIWNFKPRLNEKRFRVVEYSRPSQTFWRVNIAAKVYDYLYQARSKFIHGDNVRVGLLLPFGKRPAPPLLDLASTVYRTALSAYLGRHWEWTPTLEERATLGIFSLSNYERHLLRAVDKGPRI